MSNIYYHFYSSPIGKLLCIADLTGLIGIEFEPEQATTDLKDWQKAEITSGQIWQIFCKTADVLDRYFAGEQIDFKTLDFLTPKGTAFQHSVWAILRQIPYGATTSYGEIASQLGKPNAMRAVGNAVGRNPISILIPCHRVLGKNQTLTGFGGGLPAKRFLLQLEKIHYKNQGIEFVNPKYKKW
ncbi:cysteine methyltransferase [Vespertiliibacter pulmonis]|uniref:Methylated-DNA--protein-cysteine methyltransferase n=1 Tax=Vespertiliibacter pulmonis TaxID=1443036 RepID=A0A3N4VSY5_9PAST|nr:methylated-DNA--[protein]-cysteine S-methyltransferase [Vespertiliibacter pulmonis]QLB20176.1 cysteine methyltransferase [Vespertiliibacter pulmonis]RPE86148.1 methylated-DNA-[protein]-cysteine S-methyltransferase [Vespertiliibacter pulmonis]